MNPDVPLTGKHALSQFPAHNVCGIGGTNQRNPGDL